MFADIIFVKLCRIGFLIQAKRRKCDKICGVVTVYFHVRPQRAWIRAVKLTLVAFVRLFSSVYFQMCFQRACIRGCKVTLVAFMCLFPSVRCQMCLQMACLRRDKVTLVAFI